MNKSINKSVINDSIKLLERYKFLLESINKDIQNMNKLDREFKEYKIKKNKNTIEEIELNIKFLNM